jgi:hypothetical protein
MQIAVTPYAERRRVRDLGCAAIGEPNRVVSLPVIAKRTATSCAPSASHDVQVLLLRRIK